MNYFWWIQIWLFIAFVEAFDEEKVAYEKIKIGELRDKWCAILCVYFISFGINFVAKDHVDIEVSVFDGLTRVVVNPRVHDSIIVDVFKGLFSNILTGVTSSSL